MEAECSTPFADYPASVAGGAGGGRVPAAPGVARVWAAAAGGRDAGAHAGAGQHLRAPRTSGPAGCCAARAPRFAECMLCTLCAGDRCEQLALLLTVSQGQHRVVEIQLAQRARQGHVTLLRMACVWQRLPGKDVAAVDELGEAPKQS